MPRLTVPGLMGDPPTRNVPSVMATTPLPTFTVPMPWQHFILFPKPGEQMLSGEMRGKDNYRLATPQFPEMLHEQVRRDLFHLSPVPVSRLALYRSGAFYKGIIDSVGEPYIFVLGMSGLAVRKAENQEQAWRVFDRILDAEMGLSVDLERAESEARHNEIMTGFALPSPPLLVISKAVKPRWGHIGYYRLDPRTGKTVRVNAKGVRPTEPAAYIKPEDRGWIAELRDQPTVKKETHNEHSLGILALAKKRGVQHLDDFAKVAREYLLKNDPELKDDPETLHENVHAYVTWFHDSGSIKYGALPIEDEERQWTTREAQAALKMEWKFPAKGTMLRVNGTKVKLKPEAEQAALAFGKELIAHAKKVKETDDAKEKRALEADFTNFRKNFEDSLRTITGLRKGSFDYAEFIRRAQVEAQEKTKGKKEKVSPETRPDLYVAQDGDLTPVATGNIPQGFFYRSNDPTLDGKWVLPVKQADCTINLSGDPPKGWKGKVINRADLDYYISYRHPVTGDVGYIYLSRVAADLRKFGMSNLFAKYYVGVMETARDDLKGRDQHRRACAAIVSLIDHETFRIGSEENATKAAPTFGVATLRAQHVTVSGTSVRFRFIGKKSEPWDRTVDLSNPAAKPLLDAIKECLRGKKPGDRLWQGKDWSVSAKEVNDYLPCAPESKKYMGKAASFTAKMFRTFHANAMMKGLLDRLRTAIKSYGLTSDEVKKLVNGFVSTDKTGRALLARKVAGKGKLVDFLGLKENGHKGKEKTGLLQTVASKLGHTDGACRDNYIDPKPLVEDFGCQLTSLGLEKNIDLRTGKEKSYREDFERLFPKKEAAKEDKE